LLDLALHTGLEVVIVRPPLVYGADAPGNFGALMRAVHRGIPLPLGAVQNMRSLVALDNLVDMLAHCVHHPDAPGQVFLVSDGEDVSTPDLLRRMAAALACNARLFPLPVGLLRGMARLLGRASAIQSLCGSLQVDTAKTRDLLGWTPPIGVDEALARAARQFLTEPN
jgi:nucleoside-diphosphate-sugar epimerase